MLEVTINRFDHSDKQTLGILNINGNQFYTLELGWHDNEKKISCIPEGKYEVIKRWSEKYGNHFHILNVPNRDYILIHHGNYFTDILGCILVGLGLSDINNDGLQDVTSSKVAMKALNKLLPDRFTLHITS